MTEEAIYFSDEKVSTSRHVYHACARDREKVHDGFIYTVNKLLSDRDLKSLREGLKKNFDVSVLTILSLTYMGKSDD